MKGKVYSLEGKSKEEIDLPHTFEEFQRPDLIQKAHLAERSSSYQPKGTDPRAGLKNNAEYRGRRRSYGAGINRHMARLPRLILPGGRLGEVRKVPQAKGGRRAHPPKPEKKQKEKINKKERIKALKSAIAATADKETIEARGHITDDLKFPVVVEDSLEEIKKTREVSEFLDKIGLKEDIDRSRNSKKTKQGKGKMRGRKYRRRKTALIVVGEDKGIKRAGRNIPGLDVVEAKELSVDNLAPGGQPGRITIYTENALKEIEKRVSD